MHLHAHINVYQNSKRTNVDMLNENSLSTEKVITHTNNQSKYEIRLQCLMDTIGKNMYLQMFRSY